MLTYTINRLSFASSQYVHGYLVNFIGHEINPDAVPFESGSFHITIQLGKVACHASAVRSLLSTLALHQVVD